MSHEIATLPAQHLVVATTNFAVDVTIANLDPDLTVKDFAVFVSPNATIIPLQYWTKTSRTVITYTGPVLLADATLTVSRSTDLDRVQHTLQLGSTISSSILDAEILRLYKLIAEKLNTVRVSSQVNNVTRSTGTPSTPPAALGDEWHQIDTGGSGGGAVDTLRIWVGTDIDGDSDTNGWFEVTDAPPSPGNDGIAATVNVGSVTTGVAGSNAAVVNAGSVNAAVLNFTIPRGNPGSNGLAATLTIGNVVTGNSAIVTNSGTSAAAVLNFTIPRGDKGDVGPPGTVNAANGITFTHQATPADPGSDKTILYSKADGLPYYLPTGDVERRILNETDLYTAVVTDTTTTRTLLLTDVNTGVVVTNASAVTITIPPNSTTPIPIGSKTEVFQRGAGVLTVTGAATVVVNGVTTGSVDAATQFSSLTLWKIDTDEWLVETASDTGSGFTFDQILEPVGPTAGQTWRERSAGNLVLGEWEWSGSLWVSLQRYDTCSPAQFTMNATNSVADISIVVTPRHGGVLFTGFALTFWATDLVVTATDDWLLSADIRGGNVVASVVASLFLGAKLSDQITGLVGSFVTYRYTQVFSIASAYAFNTVTLSPVTCRFYVTKLNAAPNLNGCRVHLYWRYTR